MPAKISAEIKGLKETQRNLEKAVQDLRGTPMVNAMRDATLIIDRDAKKNAPVDTGRLRASIIPEVTTIGETVQGVIGSNVKYAPYMELGTKPHWVPIAALTPWVHRKGLAGVYSIKTKRRMGSKASQESQDRAVAFLVSRKIHVSGTAPREYLKRAFDANKDKVEKRIGQAVEAIVKQANQ